MKNELRVGWREHLAEEAICLVDKSTRLSHIEYVLAKFGSAGLLKWEETRGIPPGTLNAHNIIEFNSEDELRQKAAFNLAKKIFTEEKIKHIRRELAASINQSRLPDHSVTFVPVNSFERAFIKDESKRMKPDGHGINYIPMAISLFLSNKLGQSINLDVIQSNYVGRTEKQLAYRMAFQPTFEGRIIPKKKYIVIDDHISCGGTLTNLISHIEKQDGIVMQAITLTSTPSGTKMKLSEKNRFAIMNHSRIGKDCDGQTQNQFRDSLGFRLTCLTNEEARGLLDFVNKPNTARPQTLRDYIHAIENSRRFNQNDRRNDGARTEGKPSPASLHRQQSIDLRHALAYASGVKRGCYTST